MSETRQTEQEYSGGKSAVPGEDIVARGIAKFRPAGKEEQQITLIHGPYDPGGQPELESNNPLLLGLWGWDVAGGSAIVKNGRHGDEWSWPRASHLIREAERAGIEFELPLGFWHGFGGESRYAETGLDNFAATCGLASVTSQILLFSTIEVKNLHPLHVSRLGANFDHVSNGRWGLNISLDLTPQEAALFGTDDPGIEVRYAMADEFVTLVKHSWSLWSPFDFHGEHYESKHVLIVGPKPTRKPRPFVVSEASSPLGIDFAAKQCDWIICRSPSSDPAEIGNIAAEAKTRALERYNRELRSVTRVFAVMAATDSLAKEELERIASDIDEDAADAFILASDSELRSSRKDGTRVRKQVGEQRYRQMALGLGGIHLVGSYDDVAEQVSELSTTYGQDGLAFSFVDLLGGLHQMEDELMPRLRKMGLRR